MYRDNSGISVTNAPSCYLCGLAGAVLYPFIYDRLFDTPGQWQLRICTGCGLVWLDPRPAAADLGKLYPDRYMAHKPFEPPPRRFRQLKQIVSETILSNVFGYGPPVTYKVVGSLLGKIASLRDHIGAKIMWLDVNQKGRLLDVGCGTGGFLSRMRHLGWEVAGVEPDQGAARIAGELVGPDAIYQGTLEQAGFAANSFDAITLSHVIEHLTDPLDTLNTLKRVLKPNGRLIIYTPNADSLGQRLFKAAWIHLDPPRHLFLFSPSTLKRCVEKANLKIERIWTPEIGASYVWLASRIIQRNMKMEDGRLPRALPLRDRAQSLGFRIVETALNLFQPFGEEVVAMAVKKV